MLPQACVPAQAGTSRDNGGGPRLRGDARYW